MESFRETWRDFLNPHPDVAAHHFPVFQDLVHDMLGHVDRNGKADALIAARTT